MARNRCALTDCRKIELLLPEFLIRALDHMIEEANTEVKDGQPDMDLAAFLTFHFVVMLDPEEVMTLDREIPGFRNALIAYLIGIDFS
jgi:hypothetical protein